jgi:FAD:protein FMN transferase
MAQFNFQAIGTTWQIDIYREMTAAEEAAVLSAVRERIDEFDRAYSRFRADSLVTQMSKTVGAYDLPDDAGPMMLIYRDLYLRTGGLVTPLIGNVISDAGYDAKYSLKQTKPLESPLAWDDVIEFEDRAETGLHPRLTVKKPVLLDFGAAGKGYLIDIVAGVLEANGVSAYCVDAGGDILYKNATPIRIGLEHPDDASKVIGICELRGGSICGSAGNRRVWGDFTHIINPKTLTSPRHISAVWVTAETALEADAIATCLFFISASELSGAYDFEYVIVRDDHSVETSAKFQGEIFT